MKTLAVALLALVIGCNSAASPPPPLGSSAPPSAGVPSTGATFVVTVANWSTHEVLVTVKTPSGLFASGLPVPPARALQFDVGSVPAWVAVDATDPTASVTYQPVTLSEGVEYQASAAGVGIAFK